MHLTAPGATGRVVAVGHLMPDRTAAGAAPLVEDSRQGRGLGTRLLQHLVEHPRAGGRTTLYGLFPAGDERIGAMPRHAPVPVRLREEGGAVTASVSAHDLMARLRAPRR